MALSTMRSIFHPLFEQQVTMEALLYCITEQGYSEARVYREKEKRCKCVEISENHCEHRLTK